MKKGKNLPFPHQNRTVFSTTSSRESESEDAASAAFSSDSPIPVSENRSPSAENLCQAPSVPRLQGGEKFHAMERACFSFASPFSAPLFPERNKPPNPPRTGDRAGGNSSDSGKGTGNSGIPVVRKKSSSDGGDQVDFTSARSVIFSGRGSRWTFPDRNVFRRRDDRFR